MIPSHFNRGAWGVLVALLCLLVPAASAEPALQKYETAYYVIHTDIAVEDAREAAIRMDKMFEEYAARTRDFSGGQISRKFSFYLFRNATDYYAAGGMPGSAGVFNGSRLMAIFGQRATGGTWHVIQHEGFHQFARAVIGGNIPTWANEGLADYFGHAVFTGDAFVSGVIPQGRLKRVQAQIQAGAFRPVPEMMVMTLQQWNAGLSGANYDQGWSMVHFLAHAENGRYQQAFGNFLRDLNAGLQWRQAWPKHFGADVQAFEQRWKEYWLNLPDNPTLDLYAKATTATLTSYLARAYSQKQTFDSFEEFARSIEAGQLKTHPEDWLPPSLITEALKNSGRFGRWSLEAGGKNGRRLVCVLDEKTSWAGEFVLAGPRVGRVTVDAPGNLAGPATVGGSQGSAAPARTTEDKSAASVAQDARATSASPPPRAAGRANAAPATRPAVDPLVSAISLARSYQRAGDREKARATLEKALKENPGSPAARDAQAMLKEMK